MHSFKVSFLSLVTFLNSALQYPRYKMNACVLGLTLHTIAFVSTCDRVCCQRRLFVFTHSLAAPNAFHFSCNAELRRETPFYTSVLSKDGGAPGSKRRRSADRYSAERAAGTSRPPHHRHSDSAHPPSCLSSFAFSHRDNACEVRKKHFHVELNVCSGGDEYALTRSRTQSHAATNAFSRGDEHVCIIAA